MENYPNEAHTPYGGYRGAATAQPLEALNDIQESSSESYYPPSEGRYQQHYGFSSSMGTSSRTLHHLQALSILMKGPR
jgi:hypothetical protein